MLCFGNIAGNTRHMMNCRKYWGPLFLRYKFRISKVRILVFTDIINCVYLLEDVICQCVADSSYSKSLPW